MASITLRNTMDAALLAYFISKGSVYTYAQYRAATDQPYPIHNISRLGYSYELTINRITRNNQTRMRGLKGLLPFEDIADASTSIRAAPSATSGTAGVTEITLTVTVKDSASVPVLGLLTGRFSFTGEGDAVINQFADSGAGVYTFKVNNATAEAITIGVLVDTVTLGNFATITYS